MGSWAHRKNLNFIKTQFCVAYWERELDQKNWPKEMKKLELEEPG